MLVLQNANDFSQLNLAVLPLPVYQNKAAGGLSGNAQDRLAKKLLVTGETLQPKNQQVDISGPFNNPVRAVVATDDLDLHVAGQ